MATWWQGVWTLEDGTKTTTLPTGSGPNTSPPASGGGAGPGPNATPPASGGGTGSGASSECVRLDLGRLPSQVALRYGQAPGANMTPEDAVKRLAQAVANMTLYSDMYERVVASDANVDGARKGLSHLGAVPTRVGLDTAFIQKGFAHTYAGNFSYRTDLEVFLLAHKSLRGSTGKLPSYDQVLNDTKKNERAGDIIESIIGKFMMEKKITFAGWQANPWDVHLGRSDPLARAIGYYLSMHAAVQDFIATHGTIASTANASQVAAFIHTKIEDQLAAIMWWANDEPGDIQRRRSKAGWERHKSRDAARAAARTAARKGKGGGKGVTPPASGGASSGGKGGGATSSGGKGVTPPASGGASSGGGKGVTPPASGGKGAASSGSGDWATRGQPKGGDYVIYSDSSHSTKGGDWGELDDPNFCPRLVSPQRWADQADSEPDWD